MADCLFLFNMKRKFYSVIRIGNPTFSVTIANLLLYETVQTKKNEGETLFSHFKA